MQLQGNGQPLGPVFPPNRRFCDRRPSGRSRRETTLTRGAGPVSEGAAMVWLGGAKRTVLCEGPRTVRKSVLVVAQQIQLRARIARVLHSAGYCAELAENPKRALELAARK